MAFVNISEVKHAVVDLATHPGTLSPEDLDHIEELLGEGDLHSVVKVMNRRHVATGRQYYVASYGDGTLTILWT